MRDKEKNGLYKAGPDGKINRSLDEYDIVMSYFDSDYSNEFISDEKIDKNYNKELNKKDSILESDITNDFIVNFDSNIEDKNKIGLNKIKYIKSNDDIYNQENVKGDFINKFNIKTDQFNKNKLNKLERFTKSNEEYIHDCEMVQIYDKNELKFSSSIFSENDEEYIFRNAVSSVHEISIDQDFLKNELKNKNKISTESPTNENLNTSLEKAESVSLVLPPIDTELNPPELVDFKAHLIEHKEEQMKELQKSAESLKNVEKSTESLKNVEILEKSNNILKIENNGLKEFKKIKNGEKTLSAIKLAKSKNKLPEVFSKIQNKQKPSVKVNKFVIDMNELDTKIAEPEEFKELKQVELHKENAYAPEEETLEILNEAARRKNMCNKNMAGKVTKRFVFGRSIAQKNIENITEMHDFVNGEIYGILIQNTCCGRSTENYYKLKNNIFQAFEDKKSNNNFSNENIFVDPKNLEIKYLQTYSIPIDQSKIFLNTKNGSIFTSYFCCSESKADYNYLVDITDMVILNIVKNKNNFTVKIKSDSVVRNIDIPNLSFVIEFENFPYQFSCKSKEIFLNWVIALQIRHGRKVCSFG